MPPKQDKLIQGKLAGKRATQQATKATSTCSSSRGSGEPNELGTIDLTFSITIRYTYS